jgi:hypothetical protein
MGTVVLTVLAGWLLLSVLGTIVIAAVARGGNREERHRRHSRVRSSH